MITLYQFSFSHYCEKACWALDYKRLPYECRNLLPGPHLKATRGLAPRSSLPIVVDDGVVVQDSTAIISFLDEKYPELPLTPCDPREAKEALEWEEFLDEEIGVTLRLWFYYHTLPDRDRALRFLLTGAAWHERLLFPFMFPKVRTKMTQLMHIDAESARRSEQRLLAALARLDETLSQRRFLVGDAFSRADLTACALLKPWCAPGKSDAEVSAAFPESVCALREDHRRRPFFDWTLETYREHRSSRSSAVEQRAAGPVIW